MFKRILCPTDFSDVSKKVVSTIKKLKEAGAEEVVLLHVIDSRNLDAVIHWAPADYQKTRTMIEKMARDKLLKVEKQLARAGFSVTSVIAEGVPSQEILKAEKEQKATSIVIGSHGKSNLKEILLGSISEEVIRKAKKPVVVIKR